MSTGRHVEFTSGLLHLTATPQLDECRTDEASSELAGSSIDLGSPLLREMQSVFYGEQSCADFSELINEILALRNESSQDRGALSVILSRVQEVVKYVPTDDGVSARDFIELEFQLEQSLTFDDSLITEICSFLDHELTGSNQVGFGRFFDTSVYNESLSSQHARLMAEMQNENEDIYGRELQQRVREELKKQTAQERANPDTKTIIWIGTEQSVMRRRNNRGFLTEPPIPNDDVSAVPGIHISCSRPEQIQEADIHSGILSVETGNQQDRASERVILRLSTHEQIKEITLYYIAILFADILSRRVHYPTKTPTNFIAGPYYKQEISAIYARLMQDRTRAYSLDQLPGSEQAALTIDDQQLLPLRQQRHADSRHICLAGPPGTGKTAITTALMRENTGVLSVDIPASSFISNMKRYTDDLEEFSRQFCMGVVINLQDGEVLFTDNVSEQDGQIFAQISASERAEVLNYLQGAQDTLVKLLLTVNRPDLAYIAFRRRFLMIPLLLPEKKEEIERVICTIICQVFPDEKQQAYILSTLKDKLIDQCLGCPPDYVVHLAVSIKNLLIAEKNNSWDPDVLLELFEEAVRLNGAYPLTDIQKSNEQLKNMFAGAIKQEAD